MTSICVSFPIESNKFSYEHQSSLKVQESEVGLQKAIICNATYNYALQAYIDRSEDVYDNVPVRFTVAVSYKKKKHIWF